MGKTLIFEKKGDIGLLTINRPEKMNALSAELTDDLKALLDSLESDSGLSVLVITGAGDKAFMAGADIKELADRDAVKGVRVSKERQEIFSRIENLSAPAIAAVNGYALGAGLELALACTLRYCSTGARFGAPEVKLGIIPGDGGTQRLPRTVGPGKAMEMILTGDFIEADEAHRIGLVNAVFPPEALMAETRKAADTIASMGPVAVAGAKRVILEGADSPLSQANALEVEAFAHCFTTADQSEGMAAFLDKREPRLEQVRLAVSDDTCGTFTLIGDGPAGGD